jgi:N-acetylmuramoyl-L-alanine amidase
MAYLKTFLLILLLSIEVILSNAHAAGEIIGIRHWIAPDSTRVVIDVSDDPVYSISKEENRLAINFLDIELSKKVPTSILLKKSGVSNIQILSKQSGSVMIELEKGVEVNVFKLKKIEDKPYRVVVDVESPELVKQDAEKRQLVKIQRKKRIIIIDPGHGGDDPGAIGYGRTREKDVVLKIGQKLKNILNKTKNYQAFLTRGGDYYVPFKTRTQIAREYGGDLFISIHADAARSRGAHGTSVYCLSMGGASNEAARLLAKSENMADIIGGSANSEGSEDSDPIVLNMYQTQTINRSKLFGAIVLKRIEKENSLKFRCVQEAPFRVLKLPNIPSLLVETAFVSNPNEEKKLRKVSFQSQIAKALADSIDTFFQGDTTLSMHQTGTEPHGPPQEKLAKKEGSSVLESSRKVKKPDKITDDRKMTGSPVYYHVKRGETLTGIAAQNGTTLSELMKLNHMKLSDKLYVGQKIRLRSNDIQREQKKMSVKSSETMLVYVVKRGDCLEKIAHRHNITVEDVLAVNKLKLDAPLYIDRKILLPVKLP